MTLEHPANYASSLSRILGGFEWTPVVKLAGSLQKAREEHRQVFLCGNGGSAANAIHLANDLIYGISKESGAGIRATALPANQAIVTCLANDAGYEKIFSQQLSVLGSAGDILIVFSGSGNSPNILCALETANAIGMETHAILGYSGGKARALAVHPIHFAIDDMQIAEDLQMIVGHMIMKILSAPDQPHPSPRPA